MPKILKNFTFLESQASKYVFPPAIDLVVDPPPSEDPLFPPAPEAETPLWETGGEDGLSSTAAPVPDTPPDSPPLPDTDTEAEKAPEEAATVKPAGPSEAELELRYARIQAEAIRKDAEAEAEAWKAEVRRKFEEGLEAEREAGRQEGFHSGYAEGMLKAQEEGKAEREALAEKQVQEVQRFLEDAAREKAELLESCREEMKDMALAIAEKVIRVSLKNSSDIILRMVDAATDTHKKCEWAHIYVADCDLKGKAFTAPELTAALGHISNRVRVIPMADDESGTCIVELPDVILDASVSTQLEALREVIRTVGTDKD